MLQYISGWCVYLELFITGPWFFFLNIITGPWFVYTLLKLVILSPLMMMTVSLQYISVSLHSSDLSRVIYEGSNGA
jgi:hypothetical protein